MGDPKSTAVRHRQSWTCIAMLGLVVLLASACADPRSAYEGYIECNDKIAAATSMRGVLSCYDSDMRELLEARAAGTQEWLSRFHASRPVTTELFEEQVVDEDTSVLLIVGWSRFGQPMAVEVRMSRGRSGWKISAEELAAEGAPQDDTRPVRVSMNPEHGPEWYPGALSGAIHKRPNGNCRLRIAHVFDFPSILITTDCDRFTEARTFDLNELTPGVTTEKNNGPTIYEPVHFRDDRMSIFDQVLDGHLTVTKVGDGVVSGEFSFDLMGGSEHLQIHGSFTNLPFSHGG